MRFLLPTALVLVLVPVIAAVGCGGGASSGAGGGSTTTSPTTGSSTDSCAGLGCASGPGPLTLEVVDAMGQPVADPTFTDQGQPLFGLCENDAGMVVLDAGTCSSWVFGTLPIGSHTITVSATGYQTATVTVMIQGPAGCCGMGPAVDQKVTLQH